jgi:hypothetical protein
MQSAPIRRAHEKTYLVRFDNNDTESWRSRDLPRFFGPRLLSRAGECAYSACRPARRQCHKVRSEATMAAAAASPPTTPICCAALARIDACWLI